MSDDHNYFEFHDEESECPTEFREETVLTSATTSEITDPYVRHLPVPDPYPRVRVGYGYTRGYG